MDEKEAKALFRQAADVYRDGDYKDALKIFDRLDAAFPNNERIMFPRARCFAKLGRTEEAVALCDVLITQYGHTSAAELRARLVSGEMPALGGLGMEDTAFDPLDLNVDEKLSSAFERAAPPVPARRVPSRLLLGAGVVVVLLLIAVPLLSGGDKEPADGGSVAEAPATTEPAPPVAPEEMAPIDTSVNPEIVRVRREVSEDGVNVNASIEFGVWTNCGSYDAFLAKYAACEPAAIRMQTMGTFVMEYRVLGDTGSGCEIEVSAVQMPYASWSGKSMRCPCDTSMDFIAQTEYLGMTGILDGTLDCEGELFDAMKTRFSQP